MKAPFTFHRLALLVFEPVNSVEHLNLANSASGKLLAGAAAPAMASSSSCCALAAPLTPTAPMIWPLTMIGMPPCSGVKSLRVVMAVRPLVDHVFEEFRRPFEHNRGARFADGNVGAGGEGVVQALDGDQVAALVDDRDGAAGSDSIFCRFSDRCGDDFFGTLTIEAAFCRGLVRSHWKRPGRKTNLPWLVNFSWHLLSDLWTICGLDARCRQRDARHRAEGIIDNGECRFCCLDDG